MIVAFHTFAVVLLGAMLALSLSIIAGGIGAGVAYLVSRRS